MTPSPRPRSRHLVAALLLAGCLFTVSLPMDPVAATPQGFSSDQLQVRDLVNATRAANGMSALTMHQVFANKAQTWAGVLADCACLWHRNPPYGAGRGWYAVAENMGRGSSLTQVYEAFLSSPEHRANILTRRFTHIGTGVARAENGEIYVVQAFMDRTP